MLVFLSIFHHREFISPALLSSLFLFSINYVFKLYPGGSEVKASACSVGNPGSIPGSGRSPGEGNGNPLQYSCLENPMDGGAQQVLPWGCKESDTTEQLHFLSALLSSLFLFSINYVFKLAPSMSLAAFLTDFRIQILALSSIKGYCFQCV